MTNNATEAKNQNKYCFPNAGSDGLVDTINHLLSNYSYQKNQLLCGLLKLNPSNVILFCSYYLCNTVMLHFLPRGGYK